MGAAGGGPVISTPQAEKEWAALRPDLKKREGAPKGFQQYGNIDRYIAADIAPAWLQAGPNLAYVNPKTQYDKLLEVEAAKRQERRNRLNPPIIPPTRGAPTAVPSGAFNINQATPSILQQTVPTQGAVNSTIEDIRNAFIQSLLAGGGVGP